MSEKKLTVTYVKSAIGSSRRQKATLSALGLRRLGDTVEVQDSSAMRGMIRAIDHLLQVKEA